MSNKTSHGSADPWIFFERLQIYYTVLIIIVGFLGNSITIIIFARIKHRQTQKTSFCLISLALNDIGVLITVLLRLLDEKNVLLTMSKYNIVCKLSNYIHYVLNFVSCSIVLTFTVQRLISICFPFKVHTPNFDKRAKFFFGLLVLFGFAFYAVTLHFYELNPKGNQTICGTSDKLVSASEIFSLVDSLFTLIIPFLGLLIMNAIIIKTLKNSNINFIMRTSSNRHFSQEPNNNNTTRNNHNTAASRHNGYAGANQHSNNHSIVSGNNRSNSFVATTNGSALAALPVGVETGLGLVMAMTNPTVKRASILKNSPNNPRTFNKISATSKHSRSDTSTNEREHDDDENIKFIDHVSLSTPEGAVGVPASSYKTCNFNLDKPSPLLSGSNSFTSNGGYHDTNNAGKRKSQCTKNSLVVIYNDLPWSDKDGKMHKSNGKKRCSCCFSTTRLPKSLLNSAENGFDEKLKNHKKNHNNNNNNNNNKSDLKSRSASFLNYDNHYKCNHSNNSGYSNCFKHQEPASTTGSKRRTCLRSLSAGKCKKSRANHNHRNDSFTSSCDDAIGNTARPWDVLDAAPNRIKSKRSSSRFSVFFEKAKCSRRYRFSSKKNSDEFEFDTGASRRVPMLDDGRSLHMYELEAATNRRALNRTSFKIGGRQNTKLVYTKITKMLILVSTTFLVLNLPIHLVNVYLFIMVRVDKRDGYSDLESVMRSISEVIFYTSFSCNFFLYSISGDAFRSEFKKLLYKIVKHFKK